LIAEAKSSKQPIHQTRASYAERAAGALSEGSAKTTSLGWRSGRGHGEKLRHLGAVVEIPNRHRAIEATGGHAMSRFIHGKR
jgi:hypothetical protein